MLGTLEVADAPLERPLGAAGGRALLGLIVVGILFGGAGGGVVANPQEPVRLRILAYNVHHGAGNDEVLDLERIAALIRSLEPDLVALQEIDERTERTGGVDQAARLGELTGMEPVFGPFMDYQGGRYGMAVLSKLAFTEPINHRLPPGPEPRTSLAIRARLPGDAGELVFAGIHFYRTEEERMAQARRLLEVLEGESALVILAGDFNSTPGSPVMELIGETFAIPAKGDDHLTFPSDAPAREIDFIAYRPAARFTVIEQRVIDEPVASDHRPLLLVVELR
ncbi:MAG TPA: endonuclease/exonuclease/phosphatase family protein [Acidobacteriota bacterium]